MSGHGVGNYAPFLGPPGTVVKQRDPAFSKSGSNAEVLQHESEPSASTTQSNTAVPSPSTDSTGTEDEQVQTTRCKYEGYEKLGEGTAGSTYKVRRGSDGAWFAAKIVSLSSMKERHKRRAKAELSTLSQFSHLGILSVEDSYETEDVLILVLEYCETGDLRKQVEHRLSQYPLIPYAEKQVKVILAQLILAVYHLHVHKQILHRDIKTANILTTPIGLLKLGDFGYAKDQETAATLCGTPRYQAPEIWAREKYGRPADVWSIGIVAYELFSLRFPFESDVVGALRDLVLRGEYPRLYELRQGEVSQEGSKFVDTMLRMDPSQRPSIEQLVTSPYLVDALEMFKVVMLQAAIPDTMKANLTTRLEEVDEERKRQRLQREQHHGASANLVTVGAGADGSTTTTGEFNLSPEYGIVLHMGVAVHGGEGKKTKYTPVYLVLTNDKLIWFQNVSGIEEAVTRFPTLFGLPSPQPSQRSTPKDAMPGSPSGHLSSAAQCPATTGETSQGVALNDSPPRNPPVAGGGGMPGESSATKAVTPPLATSHFIQSTDIERVQVVPSQFSDGVPNVIAVIPREAGVCFWFKFYSDKHMKLWLGMLQRRSLAYANR